MRYTLLVLSMAGILFASDSTSTSSPIARWSSTLGLMMRIPNYANDRINTALSYRLHDEIEWDMIRLYPYLTLGWYQDLSKTGSGSYDYYDLYCTMLEGYAPIIKTQKASLYLNLGGGLGFCILDSDKANYHKGIGYIVSTGINVRVGKFVGETRIVFHNEFKTPTYSINLGYQANNWAIAALMPAGFWISAFILSSLASGVTFYM